MSVTGSFEESRQLSVGEMLKSARESKGLSVEQLAEELCLRAGHIEAIENDRTEDLPEAPFAVGFVRCIAKHFGFDSAALAAQFREIHNIGDSVQLTVSDTMVPEQRSAFHWAAVAALLVLTVLAWSWFGAGASDSAARSPQVMTPSSYESKILARVQARTPLDTALRRPAHTISDKITDPE